MVVSLSLKPATPIYIVDDGKGVAGDVDACGNDMEGVPYIKVSKVEDGSAIIWNTDEAGEEITGGALTGDMTITNAGGGYNGGVAGTLTGVEIISNMGGRGAKATVEVNSSGALTKVTITAGGSGYSSGDMLGVSIDNGNGTDAILQVPGTGVTDVRGNSSEGHYIFRLCDFQTVCGVRSFSLDLSRDELDVTTLPLLRERGMRQRTCFLP